MNGADLREQTLAGRIATWQVRLDDGANRLNASAGSATDAADCS